MTIITIEYKGKPLETLEVTGASREEVEEKIREAREELKSKINFKTSDWEKWKKNNKITESLHSSK